MKPNFYCQNASPMTQRAERKTRNTAVLGSYPTFVVSHYTVKKFFYSVCDF